MCRLKNTLSAVNVPVHIENNNSNGAIVLASQQGQQVSAVVETGITNNTAPVSTNDESHTYDSVDLESARNTSTPKRAIIPESSHTYEPTPGQQSVEVRAKVQVPVAKDPPPIVEYDVIREKSSQPLYSEIRENTVLNKKINHAEKVKTKKISYQYDEVHQDTSSRSGSQAAPPIIPHIDQGDLAGPVYHTLEDSSKEQNPPIITDDEYSAPQAHQLILPPNPADNTSPNGHGVVEAVGNNSNITLSQQSAKIPAGEEDPEPQYDEPISKSGQPKISVSTSKPTGPLFDDPFYEKGYPGPKKGSRKASTLPPSALDCVPEPPPRLESCQSAPRFNNYDDATELIKTPAAVTSTTTSSTANDSRRERDYELTELVQCVKQEGDTKKIIFDDPSYETGFANSTK